MSTLLACARALDRLSTGAGRLLGWLTLAMVLLQSTVVILRYGFSGGSLALQDAVVYLHGAAFMLGLAYALHTDSHVRVDVFYRRMGPRGKAWVNAVGTLVFLLPLCTFILAGSWHFVTSSWAVREAGASADSLGGIFLLKSLIPLAAFTLALQGLAQLALALETLIQVESTRPKPQPVSESSPRVAEEVGA
ncbi:TRAP transporter small permease subunit [Microbulbifer sediminum]|uniref:TRAP transporter small permease subunit n=1 Tax=Microbulbifer sediminum TaxID=2904250 RepID=UPI001F426574|nr:TRAP transporter small permease subunit [Microbulbifer sediminum]